MSVNIYNAQDSELNPIAGREAGGINVSNVMSLEEITEASSFTPKDVPSAEAIQEINSNLSSLKYTTSLSQSLADGGWKSIGSYTIPSDGTYLVQLTDVKGVPKNKAIGGCVAFGDKWTKVFDNGAVADYTPSAHVCVVSACTSGDIVTFYANTTQSSAYTITAEVTVIKLF